jgi:hypothetical protein
MPTSIKSGNDVLAPLREQIANPGLGANQRQTGGPTVYEYRLTLPADEATRGIVQSAILGSLELSATVASGNGGGAQFVGGALGQIFDAIPKDGMAHDILLQIAAIPVHTDFGNGSYSTGVTLRGSFELGAGKTE